MGIDYEEDYKPHEKSASKEGFDTGLDTYHTLNDLGVDKRINNMLAKHNAKGLEGKEIKPSNQNNSGPSGNNVSNTSSTNPLPNNNIPSGAENVSSLPSSSVGSAAGEVGSAGAKAVASGAEVGGTVAAEAGSTAATGTAAVAAGAPTAGVGTAVVIAVSAGVGQIKKGLKKIDKARREMDDFVDKNPTNTSSKGAIIAFLCIVLIMLFFIPLLTPATALSIAVSSVQNKVEEKWGSFIDTLEERVDFFKDIVDRKDLDLDIDTNIYSQSGLDANNVEVYKAIIDKAIKKSFEKYMSTAVKKPESFIEKLISIFGASEYSKDAAYKAFLSKRYPYTLEHSDGFYYTIGDYLNGDIPEEELNNDLNYAEIIAIISAKEDFNYENITFEEFYDILISENTSTLLYEMSFESNPTWFYYDENYNIVVVENRERAAEEAGKIVRENTSDETSEASSEEESSEETSEASSEELALEQGFGYFYDTIVMPYGLREIYKLAEIVPDTSHPTLKISYTELLDHNEIWLRGYLGSLTNMGISFETERTSLSATYTFYIDNDLKPCGRSMDYYLPDSITETDVEDWWEDDEQPGNNEDISYTPTGESVILDMTQYINQGDYPDDLRGEGPDTIKKSGCCDCSYAMCAAYYANKTVDIRKISKKYVKGNSFQTWLFLADSNMGRNMVTNNKTINIEDVVSHITSGHPVVVNIKGKWIGKDGRVYHKTTNQHYFVIVGYDEVGFYLYDPGSKANTYGEPIPYAEWGKIKIPHYDLMTTTIADFTPRYKVNTYN